jgi:hypothetical protein
VVPQQGVRQRQNVDALQLDFAPATLDLGQLEEVTDQVSEPPRMAIDHLEVGAAVGFAEVGRIEQGLGEAPDRRQRGAQLVGCVGHEVAPHLLDLRQLGDVVEHRDRAHR